MSIAEEPDPTTYDCFNSFFTRELTLEARPINAAKVVSPVDGSISQIGTLDNDKLIQAKGKTYSLSTLLANDAELANKFHAGSFATLYLSPKDYHRIHMPTDGTLEKMIYIPGKLFSVNKTTTENVDNLFARNERIVCVFNTELGKMAVIMVGAIFVGSMETVWAGQITPSNNRVIQTDNYVNRKIVLEKGDEMGRFNMGSTVILLFERNKINWSTNLKADASITMGQQLVI